MDIFTLTSGYCATNTYVIAENGFAAVVDPEGAVDNIVGFLEKMDLKPKYVLVTHGHFDHIGGVAALQRLGASVYISEQDYNLIDFTGKDTLFGVGDKFTPDEFVEDGKVYDIIGHKMSVLSTPGHTPGGVCYIFDDNTIFSGDTLFNGSVGRTDFPHADFSMLRLSLNKLFALKGDYIVWPGHGENTTLEYERKFNPYVH